MTANQRRTGMRVNDHWAQAYWMWRSWAMMVKHPDYWVHLEYWAHQLMTRRQRARDERMKQPSEMMAEEASCSLSGDRRR